MDFYALSRRSLWAAAESVFSAPMQPPQPYLGDSPDLPAPTETLRRNFLWLLLLAAIGIGLLAILLGVSTYSVETMLVPDRGGVFREGVAGAPQYMSPIWCQNDDVDRDLCELIYRGLTRLDRAGRIVPDLAAGWQVVDDVTYVFTLKPDQYWHDGQPVTADDVVFTIGVLQDPALLDTPGLPGLWRNITVEKVDDATVKFTLPQPFAPFLDFTTIGLLPQHIYAGMPARQLVTEPLTDNPIGSGPMKVTEIAADHLKLEPNSFAGGATPFIPSLEFHFMPDYSSVLAAFNAGQVDGIRRIQPEDMPAMAQREDVQLFSSVQSGYVDVLLNHANANTPFFQDPRVRRALLSAIDRESLVRDELEGQGVVAHGVVAPNNWAYNPEAPQYPFDVESAKRLLDEAGWIDGNGDGVREKDGVPLRFVLLVRDDNQHQAIGARLAQAWAAVGAQVTVTPVSFAGMVADFLAPRTFEAALTDWDQLGDPDPYPQWHSSQTVSGQNYVGWQNPEADKLMEDARKATDEGARRALYQQFQTVFANDLPALPLYNPVYTYGVNKRVNDVQIGPLSHPSERFETFSEWYIDSRRVPAGK
ncbi:MAG: peptide ABC transporter substrate-binding protein [Anaerolineales bacterium]|nr:peptide ABC transporter substrate-binding protein [Anaerolineales bacterium]